MRQLDSTKYYRAQIHASRQNQAASDPTEQNAPEAPSMLKPS